jgi:hypothetical protein
VRIVVLALLVPALAAAEVETYPLVSLPLTLGGHRTTGDGAFSWGMRPEVIAGRYDHQAARGWGVGGYGQLERASGTTLLAGGATLVGYVGSRAVAPSLGVYRRGDDDDGLQAGLFVGRRAPMDRDLPADLPYGMRLDMQLGDEQSIVISASLDTAPLVLLLGGIIAAGSHGSH